MPAGARLYSGALGLADVLEDGLAPAVDVDPRTVANTIAGAGDVNHLTATAGRGDPIVRLLVRNDDDAVIRITHAIQRLTQVRA